VDGAFGDDPIVFRVINPFAPLRARDWQGISGERLPINLSKAINQYFRQLNPFVATFTCRRLLGAPAVGKFLLVYSGTLLPLSRLA